ncbi:hypothetical protein H7J88_01555 [Mycolicibacterium flavescens]|uniref:Integral membrane protein n=1 Tax=Mycolicibacterium flavescens TaxID=1776 RepID=A0A1E3RBL5_MYCFV|nr:hypothetical protein [Mycolicibacterium flavescens]MCV7278330.1 hypothetical protein [Mycolicibacterium flavescens]ODQ87171.1 hypothetical protein BHQ18_24735 [Mycolicibacterium flavescens]
MTEMNSSRTQQVLRKRGISIAAGGLVLQLLIALGLAFGGILGILTLLLVLGNAGALAVSYNTLNDKTGLANMLQVCTVVIGLVSIFGAGLVGLGFLILLAGAVITYIGTKQLADGLKPLRS